MPDDIKQPNAQTDDAFQQYVRELEPLVEEKAPHVQEDERVFLGRLSELAPSRTHTVDRLSPEDRIWLRALETMVHRHHVSYELITNEEGEDHFWLVPMH